MAAWYKLRYFIVIAALSLGACTVTPDEEIVGDVEELYNTALDHIESGDYGAALTTLQELERQHPYSGWATRAQLMGAYANYKLQRYDEAVADAERFIRLHPGHKDLAYAYYIRAITAYDRISDIRRDQSATLEAQQALEEILRRFPQSEYAEDARLKLSLTRDHLAGQEMYVGRFYQEQERFQSAINRFRTVLNQYETSSHTPEALYRLTECYLALGLNGEAQKVAAVLGHNFPASNWYQDAYTLMRGKNLDVEPENGAGWLGINLF